MTEEVSFPLIFLLGALTGAGMVGAAIGYYFRKRGP